MDLVIDQIRKDTEAWVAAERPQVRGVIKAESGYRLTLRSEAERLSDVKVSTR